MTYEIRTIGKKIVKYDIRGLKKEIRITPQGRRKLIINIIKKNPSTPHTHIIQLAYELGTMAKATTEKYLAELEKEGIARSFKMGDAKNATKLWGLTEFAKNTNLDEGFDMMMQGTIKIMEKFLKNHKTMDPNKKEKTSIAILEMLNALEPMLYPFKKLGIDVHLKGYQKSKTSFYELLLRDMPTMNLLTMYYFTPKLVKNLKEISELLEFKK